VKIFVEAGNCPVAHPLVTGLGVTVHFENWQQNC